MSKHTVQSEDVTGLLVRFAQLKDRARVRTRHIYPVITIQEAGLDGFWIHRVLESERIESYVVDPSCGFYFKCNGGVGQAIPAAIQFQQAAL